MNKAHRPIPDILSIQRMLDLALYFHPQRLGRFRTGYYTDESLFQGLTLCSARRTDRLFD
jgi:hypothetical protein